MVPNTPRFAWATPSVASRVLSLPDGRQGQVRRLRLVPPPVARLGRLQLHQGYGYAHHPHPFGARPPGCAPLRLAVMPLTHLKAHICVGGEHLSTLLKRIYCLLPVQCVVLVSCLAKFIKPKVIRP